MRCYSKEVREIIVWHSSSQPFQCLCLCILLLTFICREPQRLISVLHAVQVYHFQAWMQSRGSDCAVIELSNARTAPESGKYIIHSYHLSHAELLFCHLSRRHCSCAMFPLGQTYRDSFHHQTKGRSAMECYPSLTQWIWNSKDTHDLC